MALPNFFIINIFTSQKFFWTILNLFTWNLSTFSKHKDPVCFLFICSIFTHCFIIILCIKALQLFGLFQCMHIHRVSLFSFLLVVLQQLHVIMLSTFCTWTGSLKWTPKLTSYVIYLPAQFFWWSLNFPKIRLTTAENRMPKLSKGLYQNKQPLL